MITEKGYILTEIRDAWCREGEGELAEVTLCVKRGNIYAVTGVPASCSLLFRVLIGRAQLKFGSVHVQPCRVSAALRDETSSLHGPLSWLLCNRFDSARWAAERAELLCKRFEIPLSMSVEHFTKADRGLFTLVLTLAERPELLLLDLAALTLPPQHRSEIMRAIDDAAMEGTAVVFSTRDLDEAQRMGRQVVVLRKYGCALVEPGEFKSKALRRLARRELLPVPDSYAAEEQLLGRSRSSSLALASSFVHSP
jgi:ABC-type multidrug transport system ATPase subunit